MSSDKRNKKNEKSSNLICFLIFEYLISNKTHTHTHKYVVYNEK